jgi:hypothetical protein
MLAAGESEVDLAALLVWLSLPDERASTAAAAAAAPTATSISAAAMTRGAAATTMVSRQQLTPPGARITPQGRRRQGGAQQQGGVDGKVAGTVNQTGLDELETDMSVEQVAQLRRTIVFAKT